MRITVELPEDVFHAPKTLEQVARELLQAAAMYWLARGEISPDRATEITAPRVEPTGEGLIDLLLSMPDVGDDADFERPLDYGRPEAPWDT